MQLNYPPCDNLLDRLARLTFMAYDLLHPFNGRDEKLIGNENLNNEITRRVWEKRNAI